MIRNDTWVKILPKRRKNNMEKYHNRFIVIVSQSRKVLYFSDKVQGHMIKPDYVVVYINGTQLGLAPGTKDDGYKVKYDKGSPSQITIKAIIEDNDIQAGVYEGMVHKNGDMNLVVFDFASKHSELPQTTTTVNPG